jgi:hypothetical protein
MNEGYQGACCHTKSMHQHNRVLRRGTGLDALGLTKQAGKNFTATQITKT